MKARQGSSPIETRKGSLGKVTLNQDPQDEEVLRAPSFLCYLYAFLESSLLIIGQKGLNIFLSFRECKYLEVIRKSERN
jgi:hypothetical protein